MDKGNYVFKAIFIDKFIKANKELIEQEDFKLTITLKKVEADKIINEKHEELTENSVRLYENYKELFENKVLQEFKTAFGSKLEIIYA